MMQIIFVFILSLMYFPFIQGGAPQTIGLFGYKDPRMQTWDPDSIKSGIVGSEEAMIYMSEKLARLGYQVVVFGNPPEGSLHSLPEANPRFVSADYNDGSLFDIAIVWRMPWMAEELRKRAKKVYLWPHDTTQGPLTESQINGFDDVLWLSQWQREHWIMFHPGFAKFTKIFGNGINPDQFDQVQERLNPYACIYGSNYSRGLEILLDIWPTIKRQFPLATLDIYYGWQNWGMLSPEKEAKMRNQVEKYSILDVQEHGLVSHEQLNQAYGRASLWTYPCIAEETFCISALRAQLAGAIPVIIDGSALKETVRHGFKCSTSQKYLETLLKAMRVAEKITLEDRQKMGEFILKEFTWEALAGKWKELFDSASIDIESNPTNKTILLALLARNKAHVLDKFLKCINNLDYPKNLITIYIKTDNNSDSTKEILQEWVKNYGRQYGSVIFDTSETSDTQQTKPHEWSPTRFKVLATIRNNSLLKAKECNCDYYFVVDCDNFIAPDTLTDLVRKDKPIIAPLLRSIPEPDDLYANFFYESEPSGYYKHHPDHLKILDRSKVGTFKVDVVHCTYLIKKEYLDKLNYIDGTDDYEFIIFSRSARKNKVDQYICNEKEYGVQIHFHENLSLEQEKNRVLPILTIP
jgi:glycosyltransferase involved in cell wall biosynthesis